MSLKRSWKIRWLARAGRPPAHSQRPSLRSAGGQAPGAGAAKSGAVCVHTRLRRAAAREDGRKEQRCGSYCELVLAFPPARGLPESTPPSPGPSPALPAVIQNLLSPVPQPRDCRKGGENVSPTNETQAPSLLRGLRGPERFRLTRSEAAFPGLGATARLSP